MFTIPLGLIGSALGLLATGTTISVVVLIGLIMLAGIVVNNAIVLVDYINRLRRDEGMEKFAAVLRAGEVRFRPILMTTSTTALGLLPMALGLGEGAEIRASHGHYRHRRAFGIHPADSGAHSRGLYPDGSQRLGGWL